MLRRPFKVFTLGGLVLKKLFDIEVDDLEVTDGDMTVAVAEARRVRLLNVLSMTRYHAQRLSAACVKLEEELKNMGVRQ